MKKVNSLFLLWLISVAAIGQPFITQIGSRETNAPIGAVETLSGDFIVLLSQGPYTPDYNMDSTRQKLIRINTSGQITDSLLIPDHDASPSSGAGLIYKTPEHILLVGMARTQPYNPLYGTVKGIRLILSDYGLNIVHDTIVWWNGPSYLNLGPPILNQYGNLVFPVGLADSINLTYAGSACWEISPFGHVIKQKFYDQFLPTENIIEIPALNCYHIYSYFHIAEIDENLDYIRDVYDVPQDSLNNNLHHFRYSKLLTDSSYVLMGQQFQPIVPGMGTTPTNDAGWEIMNVSGVWLTFPPSNFGLYRVNDTPSPFDFIDINKIYCSFNPLLTSDTGRPMYLYNYRPDGTLNWKISYSDRSNYYFTNAILATNDGGCFWMGIKFYPYPSTQSDAIIIKVGGEGNLYSAAEKPKRFHSVTVYPNPGGDFFILETSCKLATLKLYSTNGAIVLKQTLNEGINLLNTCHLPGGMYFYVVYECELLKSNGVWIKN